MIRDEEELAQVRLIFAGWNLRQQIYGLVQRQLLESFTILAKSSHALVPGTG
jgi:hypothetical protein